MYFQRHEDIRTDEGVNLEAKYNGFNYLEQEQDVLQLPSSPHDVPCNQTL